MKTSLRRSSSDSAISHHPRRRTFLSDAKTIIARFRSHTLSRRHQVPHSQHSFDQPPRVDTDFISSQVKIPFAPRNQRLKFWQVESDATCSEQHLTRQEILADIRQTWAGEERSSSKHIPRPSRERHHRNVDYTYDRREKRARGRGRGRLTTASQTEVDLSSQRRTGGNHLTVRDMRQIDPSFTSTPAIWVREDAMVVRLESVRAIILHNRVLIFDSESEIVQNAIWYIKKGLTSKIDDAFLPFEFRALEGILVYTCIVLDKDFLGIEPGLRRTLGDLPSQITNEQLEILRFLEQRLNYYYSRVRKVQQAIQAVLDEDEDMADMYLTEKRRNPNIVRNPIDHDEAEVLLETYLQHVDDLTNKAELWNRAIDDTENLIEIHLDTMQNRLLLTDLIITIFNSGLSFATMATSIFGMNFPLPAPMSTLPSSNFFFLGSVLTIMFITLFGLVVLTQWCRRQGIYSGRSAKKRRRSEKKPGIIARKAARRRGSTKLAKASQQTEDERYNWEQGGVEEKV